MLGNVLFCIYFGYCYTIEDSAGQEGIAQTKEEYVWWIFINGIR